MDDELKALLDSNALSHLCEVFSTTKLSDLKASLEEKGRTSFLTELKTNGVDRLPERQKLATAVAKAARGVEPIGAPTGAPTPSVSPPVSTKPAAPNAAVPTPTVGYVEPKPAPGESREEWLERMGKLPGCGGCDGTCSGTCGGCSASGAANGSTNGAANGSSAAAVDVSDGSSPSPPGVYRWLVDIEVWEPKPAEWKYLLDSLPEAESEKVMKFKFTADQKRALVSRLLQRRACFEATGVPWKSVSIARTKGGKPFMANKPMGGAAPVSLAPNWNFNVSHEGKYVVLAAEPNALCGVDVAAPEESRALAKKRAFSEQLDMMKGQLSPSEVRRRRRRALEAPARARARSAPHDAIRSAALPFGPTLRL